MGSAQKRWERKRKKMCGTNRLQDALEPMQMSHPQLSGRCFTLFDWGPSSLTRPITADEISLFLQHQPEKRKEKKNTNLILPLSRPHPRPGQLSISLRYT
jgi:hypothetical protein